MCQLFCALSCRLCFSFFFNDTATTDIYTLSLHDALPIFALAVGLAGLHFPGALAHRHAFLGGEQDRKSTRLNSSHLGISYAVFCLKKKKIKNQALHSTIRGDHFTIAVDFHAV